MYGSVREACLPLAPPLRCAESLRLAEPLAQLQLAVLDRQRYQEDSLRRVEDLPRIGVAEPVL